MKRISFKDIGGLNLTQAVLSGRKTMTRRVVPYRVETDAIKYAECENNYTREKLEYIRQHSHYKIGDVVAIQQAYKECFGEVEATKNKIRKKIGWTNKMFVAASMMPHHILITNICVERLQDISDEDCLMEGVYRDVEGCRVIGYPFGVPLYYTFTGAISKDGENLHWATKRKAFDDRIRVLLKKNTHKINGSTYFKVSYKGFNRNDLNL